MTNGEKLEKITMAGNSTKTGKCSWRNRCHRMIQKGCGSERTLVRRWLLDTIDQYKFHL
jgi:hypothetical protein